MTTDPEKLFFRLDGIMYAASEIVMLEIGFEPRARTCWGRIQLRGWPEPQVIGDGSYLDDSRHVKHLCAHDYGFTRLQVIAKALSGPIPA